MKDWKKFAISNLLYNGNTPRQLMEYLNILKLSVETLVMDERTCGGELRMSWA